MAGSRSISRRDFVKITTAVVGTMMGAVIGLPAIGYLIDPALKSTKADAWIPLGKIETFEIGKPALVSFTRSKVNGWEKTVTSHGVFVLRKSETDTLVLSNKCTHLGCQVNWKADKNEYVCPCHDAQLDINGKVLGGPPPRPLDRYSADQLKVEKDMLYLHFIEG
jgi:menaquinol-cytochrome c reductase iron-sulfur subunit